MPKTDFSKFTTNFIIFLFDLVFFDKFDQLLVFTLEAHGGYSQALRARYMIKSNNFSTTSPILDTKVSLDRVHEDLKSKA